jgi:hypothetical protein
MYLGSQQQIIIQATNCPSINSQPWSFKPYYRFKLGQLFESRTRKRICICYLSVSRSIHTGLPKLELYFVDFSKVCGYGPPTTDPQEDNFEIWPLIKSPELPRVASDRHIDNWFIWATCYCIWTWAWTYRIVANKCPCKQRPLLGNIFLTHTSGLTRKACSVCGPCDIYVTQQ